MTVSGNLVSLVFPPSVDGYEQRIVEFFKALGYPHSLDSWCWVNKDSPFGRTEVSFGLAGERVVAHFAAVPMRVRIADEILEVALGIHLGLDPEFRKVEHFVALTQNLVQRCEARGWKLIYGFPNNNSWLPLTRLMNWKPCADVVALEFKTETRKFEARNGLDIVPASLFDDRMASLIRSGAAGDWVSVDKTAAYLNWRYVARPAHSYSVIRKTAGQTLHGFLVTKIFEKDGVRLGHILEWGVHPEDRETFCELVEFACEYFASQGTTVASCWIAQQHPLGYHLKDIGFIRGNFTTHFGIRFIDGTVEHLLDNWFVVMGDSDVF